MDRRNFLKIAAAGLFAKFLPFSGSWSNKLLLADTPSPVVWEAQGSPDAAIKALFTSIGGLKKLIPGDLSKATILIKPNLCLPHPVARGTTTSPELVDALCGFLLAGGVKKIIIADHTLQEKTSKISKFEMAKVAERYPQAKLLLANQQRYYQPIEVNGKVLKNTETLKLLQRVDLLINTATAKHHSATHISLSLKNLMGLIWDRTAFHTELDLHQAIADLALAIRPGLNIIDASRILLNGGPTGPGAVIKENRLFAGLDPVALDSVVLSRYNFAGRSLSAKEIPHLQAACKNGIGEIDLGKIDLQKIKL